MLEPRTSSERPDISVVITAHREGVIAGVTARSALQAIDHVTENAGASVEIILVLDRTDELTRSVLTQALGSNVRICETDEGDPGQARNRGVERARGRYVSFLDGDDIWSGNWLTEAFGLVKQRPDIVAHSACYVVFGEEKYIWWHVDSEGPLFDREYLALANYWDAMAFARTEIYRQYPFKANDMKIGFAHEDWHWNCLTIAAGIPHKPVANTVHFKRRRSGSVMTKVNEAGGTVWPLEAG